MSTELLIYDRDNNNQWIYVDEQVFRIADKKDIFRLFDLYFKELEKFDQVVKNIYMNKRNADFIREYMDHWMGHWMNMGLYTIWTADIVISEYWGDKICFSAIKMKHYFHNEDISRRFEIMEI